jgi:HEAT repeat protein
MSALITALERILTCLQAQAPMMAAALQPGLTAAEIAAQLQNYPFPLPGEVLELYQWRNGSPIATPCELLPMHRFLPLAEALAQYQFTVEQIVEQVDDEQTDGQTADIQNLTGPWLPILLEGDNFYLAIGNLVEQPAAPVVYRSEDQEIVAEFDNLTSMMMAIATCWERGVYYLAGCEHWQYVDSDDAKETAIWLQHQPQQQAEMLALLTRPGELAAAQLPRAYSNLVYSQHPQATDIVLQDLAAAPDPDLQQHLISLLGDLTDARALAQILSLLQSPDPHTCRFALLPLQAWVQRGVRDDRIVDALLAIIDQVNATDAPERISGAPSEATVERETLLADLDLVIELLGDLADRRAVAPLIQLIQTDHDADNFTARQQQLVIALGKLGDERAIAVLTPIAQYSSGLMLRMAAAQALIMLGDPRGSKIFQKLTLTQFTGESV